MQIYLNMNRQSISSYVRSVNTVFKTYFLRNPQVTLLSRITAVWFVSKTELTELPVALCAFLVKKKGQLLVIPFCPSCSQNWMQGADEKFNATSQLILVLLQWSDWAKEPSKLHLATKNTYYSDSLLQRAFIKVIKNVWTRESTLGVVFTSPIITVWFSLIRLAFLLCLLFWPLWLKKSLLWHCHVLITWKATKSNVLRRLMLV